MVNMITFKSRSQAIKNADRITRAVNSVYPHVSESRSRRKINHFQTKLYPDKVCYKFSNLSWRNSVKLDKLRYRSGEGIDLFKNIIDMLKNNKIGNCYENSVMAQIIGKINGIKNIYPSKIFFNKNSSGHQIQLDHVVAIITDKPFDKGYKYNFKQKDAIVVDPWLGITEYAGDYLKRLKNEFVDIFPSIPNFKYTLKNLEKTSENIEQFNKERRRVFNPDFSFMLHHDEVLPDEYVPKLKEEFPELVFKK